MTNKDKCRICLIEGGKYPIFDGVENKGSIYSKLFQCLKEEVEDIAGYPRKICDACKNILEMVYSFIKRYKTTCKLLESGLTVVKKEAIDLESDTEFEKPEYELSACKDEPDSDSFQTFEDFVDTIPLLQIKHKSNDSFTEVKAKLKNLSEINFKKKPVRKSSKNIKPSSQVASSILEAEFEWNGESVKSKNPKVPLERIALKRRDPKLTLPKVPKLPRPPPQRLCDVCGQVFKDYSKLRLHRQQVHFSQPVSCPICSKKLASDYYLKIHTKRVHDTAKDFVCDECGKGFSFKNVLTRHVKLVHLKVISKKRFSCKLCGKTYAAQKSALIHERSVHTGHRPAECTVCGSTFYHEEYLKEHMRLHTGEAPFKCPICGRGYAQRGNMKSHVAHNHRLADLDEETKSKLKPHWFKWLKAP